jgi:DNA-binding HxlR family transcriptional regulator
MTASQRRPARTRVSVDGCAARDVLDRVGDKWSVYVLSLLGDGTRRFMGLRRSIEGISQRMLTVTLRNLERDGLISRTVYPVVPPRVDYALTPLGRTLRDVIDALVTWAEKHTGDIRQARAAYDRRAVRAAASRRLAVEAVPAARPEMAARA